MDEDVGRFEIAVDDSELMKLTKAFGHITNDGQIEKGLQGTTGDFSLDEFLQRSHAQIHSQISKIKVFWF